MSTLTDHDTETEHELYARARGWMWDQGASGWVADAFGHWVIERVAPHRAMPERLGQLIPEWNADAEPRAYRARHGARLTGSPSWRPGDPLPDLPSHHYPEIEHVAVPGGPDGEYARRVTARWRATGPEGARDHAVIRASTGALAYAEELLRPDMRDDHTLGKRVAAGLGFDEMVDLERALAARYRVTGGFPAVLEAVETRRQALQHDQPEAWAAHLAICPRCQTRPVDQPDTVCSTCSDRPADIGRAVTDRSATEGSAV